MFCPKCGAPLPDGSRFCSACGEKLPEAAGSVPEASAGPAAPEPNVVPPEPVQVKTPPDRKKLLVIALTAVVVAALILGLKSLFTRSSADAYACLSDGSYLLITDLAQGKTAEISPTKSLAHLDYMLQFSPDGKYLYYFTNFDEDSYCGTLCRAEYAKLKAGSGSNDAYLVTVAANVRPYSLKFLEDGRLLYQNASDTLYYYDLETPVPVAKDIYEFSTDGKNRLFYVTNTDSRMNGYHVLLDDLSNPEKLFSGADYIQDSSDLDHIYFSRIQEDGTTALYQIGPGREPQKLGDDAWLFGSASDDPALYMTCSNGARLSLYDFVEDPGDPALVEPVEEDFAVPVYDYKMISDSDPHESDYDELYTSCTRDLYWLGKSRFWCYSMEDSLNMSFGDETEALHAALQRFIDRFGSQANEDGFIPVTDEVKAALQEIHQYADDPDETQQWVWLCYNRYQSGTDIDYDAYNAAYETWSQVQDRDALRRELQDSENDWSLRTLYSIRDGKPAPIQENVLSWEYNTGYCVLFNTPEIIDRTIPIEDVESIYDVMDLLTVDYSRENYLLNQVTGSIWRISAEAADAIADCQNRRYANLYCGTEPVVYLSEGNGILSVAKVENGQVGAFRLIDDSAAFLGFDGTTLYYGTNIVETSNAHYGDFCAYSGGSSRVLARDVILDSTFYLYEDGAVLAYTDRDSSGNTLTLFSKDGTPTRLADGVAGEYIRVNESTVLYLSDGDLYCWDGKQPRRVCVGVDKIWSRDSVESSSYVYIDEYYDYDYSDYDYT